MTKKPDKEPEQAEPKSLAEILKTLPEIVSAQALGQALKAGEYEPGSAVAGLIDSGALVRLGSNVNKPGGKAEGFRYAVRQLPDACEAWVSAIAGPAVDAAGHGPFEQWAPVSDTWKKGNLFTLAGCLTRLSGKQVEVLSSRAVGVTVETDPAKIAKRRAAAVEKANERAKTMNRQAAELAELGT